MAHTIYRELSDYGYDDRQVVELAAELIGEVTSRLEQQSAGGALAPGAERRRG